MIKNQSPSSPPLPSSRAHSILVCLALTIAPLSLQSAPSSTAGLTPPELLELVHSSLEKGDPDTAASTFMVALAYSFYDTRRTSDSGSREIFADTAARALSDLPASSLATFAKAGQSLSSQPQKISALLSSAGRPRYSLSYLGNNPPPRRDFDPSSVWKEIITKLSRSSIVPR